MNQILVRLTVPLPRWSDSTLPQSKTEAVTGIGAVCKCLLNGPDASQSLTLTLDATPLKEAFQGVAVEVAVCSASKTRCKDEFTQDEYQREDEV